MAVFFGVVADDFTGACDAGIQFKKKGLETLVLAKPDTLGSLRKNFDVVVIDTETRNVTAENAYKKVRDTLRRLRNLGIELVYKKIDSTLRGNLGAELNAVLDELDLDAVIVAPAFPEQGRTVVNGQLMVNNVPLEKSEFARDPLNPVKESHIINLIGRQTSRKIGYLSLSKVRSGDESVNHEIQRLIQEGAKIIVADCETREDLAKIAKASADCNMLPCGSAGLALHVAELLNVGSRSRLLVVSGSTNKVTLGQIALAEDEPNIVVLDPDFNKIFKTREELEAAIMELVNRTGEAFVKGKDVIIRAVHSENSVLEIQETGKSLGLKREQVAEKILSVLSGAVKRIAKSHRLAGLTLIGGDAAVKIMDALGASGVRIDAEILPGVPIGIVIGGPHDGLRVVTKAGGFGDINTVVNIIRFFRGER